MKFLLSIILMFVLYVGVFACGAPQPIYGTAPAYSVITLDGWGISAIASPFGYYELEPVQPCFSYEVRMSHKTHGQQTAFVHPIDFQGKGVEVNFGL